MVQGHYNNAIPRDYCISVRMAPELPLRARTLSQASRRCDLICP